METGTQEPVNLRILVVEDNFLIAESIADALESAGFTVVGPVPNVRRSEEILQREAPDAAVLDINLGSELCFPIAFKLKQKGIPFLFLSGYDDGSIIPAELKDVGRFTKPLDFDAMTCALQDTLHPDKH